MPATTAKNAMPNKADATAAAASRTLDCMRLALQARDFTYEGHLDAARWAERRGLEALAIPDHYLGGSLMTRDKPFLDALAVLAGLARETSHIELVLLVSPVTFRHPAVMAKNAATIQEMTDGRLTFGVGLGWLEQEFKAFGPAIPATEPKVGDADRGVAIPPRGVRRASPGPSRARTTVSREPTPCPGPPFVWSSVGVAPDARRLSPEGSRTSSTLSREGPPSASASPSLGKAPSMLAATPTIC